MAVMDMEEEEEVLFSYTTSTPPPSYYVQSPSTISNANSFEFQPIHELSPHPTLNNALISKTNPSPEASRRFTCSSRCSSTRESLMSNVLSSKKLPYSVIEINGRSGVDHKHDQYKTKNNVDVVSKNHDDDDDVKQGGYGEGFGRHYSDQDHEDELVNGGKAEGWWKYLSFGTYDGLMWTSLQLTWRFMVSLAAALLVFYVATKPPPPHISVKVVGIKEFELGEGVDASGVSTKILSCNTSVELLIDNQSKVFGLHLHPPLLQMSFQHLTFAVSQGEKVTAERERVTPVEVYVGTRSKPMYGAGRMMQDMLDSGQGLPLAVSLSFVSNYHVFGGFIKPWFHHQANCLLVLSNSINPTHHFNTTCTLSSS